MVESLIFSNFCLINYTVGQKEMEKIWKDTKKFVKSPLEFRLKLTGPSEARPNSEPWVGRRDRGGNVSPYQEDVWHGSQYVHDNNYGVRRKQLELEERRERDYNCRPPISPICWFYASEKGCWRGDRCPYEHEKLLKNETETSLYF